MLVPVHSSGATSGNFTGTIKYPSPTSPAALAAGDTNDYAPGVASANSFRVTANAAGSRITGFASGSDGLEITLFNIQTSAGDLTIGHQNAGSSATNRIICPGEVDLNVPVGGSVTLRYDATTTRWRVVQ